MHEQLKQAMVNFPEYWNAEGVVDALKNKHQDDLLEYFGCANTQSLARKLNPCFPNRPAKMSYRQYLTDVLNTPTRKKWDISEMKRQQELEAENAKYNT